MSKRQAFLIEKSWVFESYGLDENNNGVIEASENILMPCENDDRFTFMANGEGFFEGGDSACTDGEPPIRNFIWSFSNDETELTVFAFPEKINRLDDNFLEVYYMDQNSSGEPVKFIRRFRH